MNSLLLTNFDLKDDHADGDEITINSFRWTTDSINNFRNAHLVIYLDHATKIAQILKCRYEIDAISLKY